MTLTDDQIDALAAGPAADAAVAECFEPKPPPMTYREAERKDAAWYPHGGRATCFTVYSPGGHWKIDVDWCDVEREGMKNDVAEWKSATEYTSEDDPGAAMGLLEEMYWWDLRGGKGHPYECTILATPESGDVYGHGETLSMCVVRAYLKAKFRAAGKGEG